MCCFFYLFFLRLFYFLPSLFDFLVTFFKGARDSFEGFTPSDKRKFELGLLYFIRYVDVRDYIRNINICRQKDLYIKQYFYKYYVTIFFAFLGIIKTIYFIVLMDIHLYFYIDTIFRPGLSRSSSGINYKSLKMMANIVTSRHYSDFNRICASIGFQWLYGRNRIDALLEVDL